MSSPRLVPDSVSVPFGNSVTATTATMKQYKILSGPEPSEAPIVNTGPITSVISKLGTWTGDPRWN
jgi:hypothetical protein